MAYCTVNDIRLFTNLSEDDISDTDLGNLIPEATTRLNSRINVEVIREYILPLDNLRENKMDGSNKTYYIRNWYNKYFGDRTNDGSITTDDITVIAKDNEATETEATVSSINPSEKSFTLETAYDSGYRLFVTYEWCYVDPSEPDNLIRLACIFLTAALAYFKINVGRSPQVNFGNARIVRHIDASRMYEDEANKIIEEINYKMGNIKEAENEQDR